MTSYADAPDKLRRRRTGEPAAASAGRTPKQSTAADESECGTTLWPAAVDRFTFESLARLGLTLDEILAQLQIGPATAATFREVFLEAQRRGRAEGRGEIKRAQYGAALDGKISAQERVLALLDDEDDQSAGAAEDTPLRIVKTILPSREKPPWEED